MFARLAQTCAAHEHGADPKFMVDEMIERDTGRRDVAAAVRDGELDSEPLPRGVEYATESASTASISISVTSRPPCSMSSSRTLPSVEDPTLWAAFDDARVKLFAASQTGKPASRYGVGR
jgi:hypothetical protein